MFYSSQHIRLSPPWSTLFLSILFVCQRLLMRAINSSPVGHLSFFQRSQDFWGGPHKAKDTVQLKDRNSGLPWWRSGWESACQCRGHGFKPWSGKIPHAAEQLGPWATITEPACLEPVLRNKRGHDSERPAHCDEEWPPLATTRESPRTETKTQHSHK